ncbi:MAG: flagellar basal body rod protein FlgB [Calditrichia bacterium]
MIKDLLFKRSSIPVLAKGLDVYALRQKTIAGNIANVQTEGYQRKDVEFEAHLQDALAPKIQGKTTHPGHMLVGKNKLSTAGPRVVEDFENSRVSGVNNVDIDHEIVEQVKNEIRFQYGSRLLSRNFAALRASIKGRFDI